MDHTTKFKSPVSRVACDDTLSTNLQSQTMCLDYIYLLLKQLTLHMTKKWL